ncbi:MAG: hypothetical protein RL685_7544, partial [Pseudomonadota bacterium]
PFTHLFLDDYIQRAMLRGSYPGMSRPLWDLFRFTSTEPALREAQVEHLLPWFGDPELRLAFFRPLSSALVAFDVALFGQDARAQLLHGGLWYVALCVLAARWYQRHWPGLAGGVAGCAFALTASHQQAVTWFSARNALVAATFSLLALSEHERFREGEGARHRWLSIGFLALALAGGEGGLGGMALLAAYELSRPALYPSAPAALLARCAAALRQLMPVLVLAFLYLALHAALGYGAHASGAYLDPLSDPLGYLAGLPQRLLAALGVLVLTVPGEIWTFVPELRAALSVSGVLALLLAALWFRAHHALLSRRQQVALRYAALATLGSLLPQLAGSLGARSFVLPSLGACALLGLCAQRLHESWLSGPRSLAAVVRALPVLVLLGLHLVGGPLQWWRSGRLIAGVQQASLDRLAQLELDDATVASDTVLLLSAPDAIVGVYGPFLRAAAAEPLAAHWRILSLARRDHQVRRLSDHSFELTVLNGDILDSGFAELFRHSTRRFQLGAEVARDGLSAQVVELSERGQPTRIQFTTAQHLDDPQLRLYAWHEGRMRRLQLRPSEERKLSWVAPF